MKRLNAQRTYLFLEGASTFFNALMFTILTVYYVTQVGLNPFQLVLVGTVMEIAVFLFEVPTGVIADTYSRRLSVIIGLLLNGVGFLIVGAAPVFALVLLGNIIWGIGATFLSGALQAWITDEVGEAEVGQLYLRASQIGQFAALTGTFVSVGLASVWLTLPILVGATLTVLLGVFLVFVMPEHGFKPAPRGERHSWQALANTLGQGAKLVRNSRVLLTILGITITVGAFTEGIDRLGKAHLLENFTFPGLGALEPVVWFGILSAGAQILSIGAAEILRRRVDMTNTLAITRMLFLITGLLIVSIVTFGLANSFTLAIAAYWAVALLRSLYNPLYQAWLSQNTNSQTRATVISIMSQGDALGQSGVGPVIGVVGTVFSLRAAMVFSSLFLAPALLLYGKAVTHRETVVADEVADVAPVADA